METLMRAMLDGAIDAMLIADDAGSYVDVNPAACALFGLSRAELLTRSARDLAGSELSTSGAWHRFLRDGRAEGQFRLLRAGGEYRDVYYRATASVCPNLHLSVLRDMTYRREQLSQARRTAAVGPLAHDFNNLLSIIMSYSNLALEELEPEHPMRSDIAEVCRAAEHAAELTRQLLALGREADGLAAAETSSGHSPASTGVGAKHLRRNQAQLAVHRRRTHRELTLRAPE